MPAKQARFDDALVSWYENAAKNENAIRLKKGLKPLAWVDLLRVVAERFAGLPASHDVDLEGVQRRAKRAAKKAATTSDMWTKPHGGKTAATKASAKQTERRTPPHGG